MRATKEQIKQWLDTQIGAMYIQYNALTLTEKIDYLSDDERGEIVPDVVLKNFSSTDHVHIGNKALRYVAKIMELPIVVVPRENDEDYPYELQFYYNGVQFMALESEEAYKENGELA